MQLHEALGVGFLLIIALVYLTGSVDKVKRMFGMKPKKASPNKEALDNLLRHKRFDNVIHIIMIIVLGGLFLYGLFVLGRSFFSE